MAWLTGGLLTFAGMACIALTFAIRLRTERAKRFRKSAAARWEETLFDATSLFESDSVSENELADLARKAFGYLRENPDFERQDLPLLLYEWNYIHESLIGDSKRGLNFLARTLDLHDLAVKALNSPALDRRLLAINTLGNLGDEKAYIEIEKILDDRDPVIASWAWRALFRIDTPRTIDQHFSILARREDWSPILIARVLQEIEADERSEPLCRLVADNFEAGLSDRQMSRLISYLSLAHVADYTKLVNRILLESNETEVLIACLRLINSDDDLSKIRELIADERWEIRMQVGLTLGRLAHEEDIDRLIHLLDDPDWWVRYRTATALATMPQMNQEKVGSLSSSLPNQFARDILQQVLAEMQLTCFTQTSLTLSR